MDQVQNDSGICNSHEYYNNVINFLHCDKLDGFEISDIHPNLIRNYDFENERKTMKPGPKSKTRYNLSLDEMIKQINDDGINPINGQPKDGVSFVDSIYIHPNLLKFFDFKYTRKTNKIGPKSKTRYPLSMFEKYVQIVKAGINPVNGHYLTDYSILDIKYVHPDLIKSFPFKCNRNNVGHELESDSKDGITICEKYQQILNAGINPFTGRKFGVDDDNEQDSDDEDIYSNNKLYDEDVEEENNDADDSDSDYSNTEHNFINYVLYRYFVHGKVK